MYSASIAHQCVCLWNRSNPAYSAATSSRGRENARHVPARGVGSMRACACLPGEPRRMEAGEILCCTYVSSLDLSAGSSPACTAASTWRAFGRPVWSLNGMPLVESFLFLFHITLILLWTHVRKLYLYEYFRRLSRQIFEIDEVTRGTSLLTRTSPTI